MHFVLNYLVSIACYTLSDCQTGSRLSIPSYIAKVIRFEGQRMHVKKGTKHHLAPPGKD